MDGFLVDSEPDRGPLSGILSGLRSCQTGLLLVLAIDLAWMEPECLRLLVADRGVIPELDGKTQPLSATYPKACTEIASRQLAGGHLAARHFADECCQAGFCRKLPMDLANQRIYFRNWNNPSDAQ